MRGCRWNALYLLPKQRAAGSNPVSRSTQNIVSALVSSDAGIAIPADALGAILPINADQGSWIGIRHRCAEKRDRIKKQSGSVLTYRVEFIFRVLNILLKIYLLKVIWTAVYAGRGVVDGVELRELIAFITLAQFQVWVMLPFLADYIQERVQEGTIALDLARPVPFIGQLLALQLGATVSYLPFLVLAIPFVFALGGFVPPASLSAGLLYLLSLSLGYLVSVLLSMLLGLASFWIIQTWGALDIYYFTNQFFTGALVPLWFFPSWLRQVAELLPFQAQTFIPLAIYIGQVPAHEIPTLLGIQVSWVIVLFLLVWFVWQRAMRRVIIYGG
jgi:ABC-2 type transport system permease protein